MNCPNCNRDVVDIIPAGGDKPKNIDGFCHIGSATNNGNMVWVIH